MNDYIQIATQSSHDRKIKQMLRSEVAAWQRAVFWLLVLSTAVNIFQYGIIKHIENSSASKDQEIARWKDKYNSAVLAECDAIQAYEDLSEKVAAEQEARIAQEKAYESVGEYTYMGIFRITAYCPCEECCGRWADGLTSTGIPAVPGIVAVDQDVIPIGSTVIIDGQKYLAADTGVTGHCVDVFMTDHEASVQHGVKTVEVWAITS